MIKHSSSQLQIQQQNLRQLNFGLIDRRNNTVQILRQKEDRFQTLIDKTSAAIFIIQGGKICYANPMAELTTGYSQWQLLNNTDFYYQLHPPKDESDSLNFPYNNEIKIKVKDNREYWLNCCWETVEWNDEPAIMITAFDITKYKQTEAKLDRALIAQKELCQNEAQFVSMVSHEFRTPLNIISFSTSLLKRHLDRWTKTKQLKYLDRLQTVVEQLNNVIDEVLIIGRVETGKFEFAPQPLNLNSFCDRLLTEINLSQSASPQINFINLSKCETILVDEKLLKLVLVNLLGNAIKYSPANSTIEFLVFSQSEQVIFQIEDRGIGIPSEEQSKIFEPFHRSNNVGEIPGHGLGLAIVKKLVELQNGQITLKSDVKVGSTFRVSLPLILTRSAK